MPLVLLTATSRHYYSCHNDDCVEHRVIVDLLEVPPEFDLAAFHAEFSARLQLKKDGGWPKELLNVSDLQRLDYVLQKLGWTLEPAMLRWTVSPGQAFTEWLRRRGIVSVAYRTEHLP